MVNALVLWAASSPTALALGAELAQRRPRGFGPSILLCCCLVVLLVIGLTVVLITRRRQRRQPPPPPPY
jgi:hypothetical protein